MFEIQFKWLLWSILITSDYEQDKQFSFDQFLTLEWNREMKKTENKT